MSRHKPKAGDRYWKRSFDGRLFQLRVLSTASGRVLVRRYCPTLGEAGRFLYWSKGEFFERREASLLHGAKFAPAPSRR